MLKRIKAPHLIFLLVLIISLFLSVPILTAMNQNSDLMQSDSNATMGISEFVISSSEGVTEALNSYFIGFTAAISPDGEHIIQIVFSEGERYYCLHKQIGGEKTCYLVPDELAAAAHFIWSPNSQYIAFTTDFFVALHEPDLWVLDVTTGEYRNLTPDDVDGSMLDNQSDGIAKLDVVYSWTPDNRLLFVRTVRENESVDLYYVDPRGGEPELISTQLPSVLIERQLFALHPLEGGLSLDGSMTVSPDGHYAAIALFENENYSSVWQIDLTGEEPARKLLSHTDIQQIYPSEFREEKNAQARSLAWNADGSGLFVHIQPYANLNSRILSDRFSIYYVDVQSGEFEILMELGHLELEDITNPELGIDGIAMERLMPQWAVMTPSRNGVIGFKYVEDSSEAILTLMVPGQQFRADLYTVNEYYPPQGNARMSASMSIDGTFIIGDYILSP